jgi:O-acetyl-ADP-ribose deacetylase
MITFAYEHILNLQVDAIVNPAHTSLFAGSGLCGIIHRYAGRELETYCRTLGTKNYGDVVITPSFKLPNCKKVIHACGPRWIDGNQNEEANLEHLYTGIIEMAAQTGISSIAIPAISTGIYSFPFEKATRIALKTCLEMAEKYPMDLIFVNSESKKHEGYQEIYRELSLKQGNQS